MRQGLMVMAALLAGIAGTGTDARANDWRVTTAGYGPARIGMSVADTETALGTKLVAEGPVDNPECHYLRPEPAVEGLWFMVANDRVVRIEVTEPGITTRSGLGVGDSEARVKRALGASVEVTPHKYVAPDGNYLTIWSADRRAAVRFETLNGKVSSFYAGQVPQVTFVEGCS